MARLRKGKLETKLVLGSASAHADATVLVAAADSPDRHVDRILLSACHLNNGADAVSAVRLYTIPDDIAQASLSASVPDDNDSNIWFKQALFHESPIYASWRPKRTIAQGETLYLDCTNKAFLAAYEAYVYCQFWYHELN